MSRKSEKTQKIDIIINNVLGGKKEKVLWLLNQFKSVEQKNKNASVSQLPPNVLITLRSIYPEFGEYVVCSIHGVYKVVVFDIHSNLIAILDKGYLYATSKVIADNDYYDDKHPSNGFGLIAFAESALLIRDRLPTVLVDVGLVNSISSMGRTISDRKVTPVNVTSSNNLDLLDDEDSDQPEPQPEEDPTFFVINRADALRVEMLLDAARIEYGRKK